MRSADILLAEPSLLSSLAFISLDEGRSLYSPYNPFGVRRHFHADARWLASHDLHCDSNEHKRLSCAAIPSFRHVHRHAHIPIDESEVKANLICTCM